MKNLFSERYKYKKLENLKPDEMPDFLRNRLWNVIKEYIDSHKNRDKVIEIVWDEFFKEAKDSLKSREIYDCL